MKHKIRLDQLLINLNLAKSQKEAGYLIISGAVLVEGLKTTKCGHQVQTNAQIRILKEPTKYVSRSGEKLAGALRTFDLDVNNRIALDIGISTGGFTDVLLQKGIKHVFGVDVAYGTVDNKIRQNPKVTLLERTNARYLSREKLVSAVKKQPMIASYIDQISLVVMDVSFISITKILPAIQKLTTKNADYLILIKPQFEAPRGLLGKNGIIKDKQDQQKVLTNVKESLRPSFNLIAECPAQIKGIKGNQEYFFWLNVA
ncbi:TlyA family RNA methyltransferase [Candidatus Margulisiibacteriota bacterium]